MYGVIYYDVIVLEHGSREINFSSTSERDAIAHMKVLFEAGHKAYVVRNTVQLNGVVKKHLLDPYNNYVPYEVNDNE